MRSGDQPRAREVSDTAANTPNTRHARARCLEVISKGAGEDQDHRELDEGLVGLGFAVAAGGDPAAGFQPGVGAFDLPALAALRVARFLLAFAAAPDGRCRAA